MHTAVREFIAAHAPNISGDMLEIGARDINGGVRDLFHPNSRWTGLDITAGDQVDIVADASTWEPPRNFDIVVCTEVLEHAERWREIVVTCFAALRPGGLLLLTCAGPGRAPHGQHGAHTPLPGEFYANVDPVELAAEVARWARDWSIERLDTDLRVRAWKGRRGD